MESLKLQLLQRIQYLERTISLDNKHKLSFEESNLVIEKLKSLVDQGGLKTFLGVDAAYYFLIEKVKIDSENLDQYAEEIRDFVN